MRLVTSLSQPERQAKVLAALKNVADSGQFSEGAFTFKLEKQFSIIHNGHFSISFNSDSSAFYTLFRFYAERGHKLVAIPNNSPYVCASMAIAAGLRVVVIDSLKNHPGMSVDSLKEAFNSHRITLVCISHCGGFISPDYGSVYDFCDDHGAVLVEDCTEALGIKSIPQPHMLGESSVWSMHHSTAVPAGELGIITTQNLELRNYARLFRQCGRRMMDGTLCWGDGMNWRISEWDAAVASIQLESMPDILAQREKDAEALHTIVPCLLEGPTNWTRYPVSAETTLLQTVPQMYASRDQIAYALKGVLCSVNLPNSYRWSQTHKCLPIGEGLYTGLSGDELLKYLRRG